MKWMLCRVMGHQQTRVAFTSNRFICRRCGTDLGFDFPVRPSLSTAVLDSPPPPPSRLGSRQFRREDSSFARRP